MPAETMLWISGWASNVSQWHNVIQKQFPAHQHEYMDYGLLLEGWNDLHSVCPQLEKAAHVVAWSMGTLALLRQSRPQPPQQRWTLLAAVADFCAPEIGWPLRTVQIMERQVLKDPVSTLERFADLMGPQEASTRALWLENALRYTPQQLARGLRYLADQQAPAAALSAIASNEVRCLWNRRDQVVQAAQASLFAPQQAQSISAHGGHWLNDYLNQIPCTD